MRLTLLAAALLLAACSQGPAAITGPVDQTSIVNGLEHELRIEPADATTFPNGKAFNLKSRLINRTDAPMTVRVVTCWLDPKVNLRTRASFIAMAIPGCVPEPNVITLAPGQASRTLWFTGEIERPGRYTIEVRHALDPEFWTAIQVTAR